MITNKQILEIANNADIMYLLGRIKHETENLCYKTEYEQNK